MSRTSECELDRPATDGPWRHLPGLDGVRGVAILVVVVFHFVQANALGGTGPISRALIALAMYGWSGVDLFFVLSGFLITGILLGERDRAWDGGGLASYFGKFYARRTLRIFPLYYAFLVVLFVVVPHLAQLSSAREHLLRSVAAARNNQLWYWTYTVNWPLAFERYDAIPFPTTHLWTLSVEEQFYLLWPAVVLFARTDRTLAVACVCGVVIATFLRVAAPHTAGLGWPTSAWSQYATLSRMDDLCLGAITVLAVRHNRMTLPHSGLLVGTGSGAVCLLQLPVFAGIAHVLVYTANAMVAAGLVASAVLCGRDGMLSQWWRQPWLAWAGRYSYGIYVIHTVVLWRLLHTFPFRHDVLHATMWFAAYVVGSAALAVASRRLLEDPFLRLKVFFNSNGASATAASGSKPLQTAN